MESSLQAAVSFESRLKPVLQRKATPGRQGLVAANDCDHLLGRLLRRSVARNQHGGPVRCIALLAITPASKPFDARGEVVGVGLEEVAFMLVKDDGELLRSLLNVEAKTIPMTSGRKGESIYLLELFVFKLSVSSLNLKFVGR